jgi:2-succinyl-5-enolpyruvyl-6-hydroxy-3-cyclohexene-1-carboxylate synthase
MTIDLSNINMLWASILAETLHRLGLEMAIICPGSRSAPLAIAFARHPHITAIPVLDERSASFFALGVARRTHRPVALVCTSGTAGANFYPAVIEARESRVPLLLLTADRPPELRDCRAGQAIDQQRLFGTFPNGYFELAVPELAVLDYLRQTLIQAWGQTRYPVAGPVHLNLPFRDPLIPAVDLSLQAQLAEFDATDFFAALDPTERGESSGELSTELGVGAMLEFSVDRLRRDRGLILVGPVQPENAETDANAIAQLSKALGYPVLAEGLSPLRNFADLNPNLIAGYDLILRHPDLQSPVTPAWTPEVVIQIGDLPTSKALRTWLTATRSQRYVIAPDGSNLDPLHGHTTHLRWSITSLVGRLSAAPPVRGAYLQQWHAAEQQVQQAIAHTMQHTTDLIESKVAWTLAQVLPAHTALFISNSMPVRDVEYFWPPNARRVYPYFNRGANGIDGTLSTALGVAYGHQSVLLTGDLALLHDTNGFLLRSHFHGHLTIVLINNNGGGIFEMLPIAQFDPPFEEFFATPQSIDFAQLSATYDVVHELIQDWQHLRDLLNPLPSQGIRILEVRTDRHRDATWRKTALDRIATAIDHHPG